MTAKNKNLFLKEKKSLETDNDNLYSNISLMQTYKSRILVPVQSFSKSYNKKYGSGKRGYGNKYNSDYTVSDKCEGNEKLQKQKTSSDTFDFANFNDKVCETSKNQWKKGSSTSDVNKSTLSLHICAYENSFETASESNSLNGESNENLETKKSKAAKKWENVKQISTASKFVIQFQNPIEFPRQQNNEILEPELSQFKASQQLSNPNTISRMNLCKLRFCYLKAVESSEYCCKHVTEEVAIKETMAPKCSFISEMKLKCDETVNNEGSLCDKHANHRKILAEMERDFVSNLDYISKNVFENITVKQQEDVEHGFEQTKSDIAKNRKEFTNSNETTFAKLATENFLKVYAADCDKKLESLIQSPLFMETINAARENKLAEDTFMRVFAEFSQARMKQTGYESKYIKKGREIYKYLNALEEAEKNKMDTNEEDRVAADVDETVRFMVGVIAGEIPLYDPRIPAEYSVGLEFNRNPCPNISCSKCRKIAIFKGLCLDHSREPIFDEDDNFGYQVTITDEIGEPNNPEASKTSGVLFIHGKNGEKEITTKPLPRNTYSNWSTRSQHGLIANLPSTSELFIRTAKNARYPLVNASYHSPLPTLNAAPRMSRMQNPQPQITFSRTLALGHPPTRMRFDNHSIQLAKVSTTPTLSTSSGASSSSTNVPHSQHQPTYSVIHRYPHEFNTATIIQTNDPLSSAAFRARQRLPQPPGYRYNAPPTFRVVRQPTIRIMTKVSAPRIVPSHQPRHP